MSSETVLISIVSTLFMIVQILLAYIFNNTRRDLKEAAQDLKEALKEHIGRFEKYVEDKNRFDYQFRHDEYAKRMVEVESRLWDLEKLPERVEQLWKKIFNGVSK